MVGSKKTKRSIVIRYILTTLLLLVLISPFIYLILHSFADWDQVDRKLIPTSFSLRSWKWLFGGSETTAAAPWLSAFFHSLIVSTVSTAFMLLFGVMTAYALAKLNFRGKKFINRFITFQMFFPVIILLIPQFLMITKGGLLDSFAGMIIPTVINMLAIFMYSNFFRAIPDSLIEAAKLDGANDLTILFRIILPMTSSLTTVIFLFIFTDRWTNLLWDMIVTKSDGTVTLNVLISQMFGPYQSYPGPMYAASVLLTVPLILLFLAFSKKFSESVQDVLK
ncbi:MAG TPA: carbohydrate ABC transporter permease [Candidatus Tetragenococcus pullicola]|nr:carbohydrate ABC transporter permease [Candidatus Tetragenococcus pullicola]